MHNFKFILLVFLAYLNTSCDNSEKDSLVTISTKYGDMNIILYDETPQHKENFLKLARSKQYDSTVFHRVIQDFMIQGGDVNAKANETKVTHTVPAEFHNHLLHEKGAVAAARQGDQINPKKASSGDQFYIVKGKVYTFGELDELEEMQNSYRTQSQFAELLKKPEYADFRNELVALQRDGKFEEMEQRLKESTHLIEKEYGQQQEIKFTPAQREAYTTVGGTPHLDGTYTVFGKVISGLHVIDSVAKQITGPGDRPKEDIFMTVKVEEMSKGKISEKFGYQFPEKQ